MPSFVVEIGVKRENFPDRTKKWKVVRLSVREFTGLPWDLECDDESASRVIAQLETRGIAVQTGEPCLSVSQTNSTPSSRLGELLGLDPRAIVFYFNTHDTISRCGNNLNMTGG